MTKVSDAIGGFVDRHMMVVADDEPTYVIEGSGWLSGIAPPHLSPDETMDLLDRVFAEHWDGAVASLGNHSNQVS